MGNPSQMSEPDGIIPPRISRSKLINKTGYGTDQVGALVYVTDLTGTTNIPTANIDEMGFYYFDGTAGKKSFPPAIMRLEI